MLDYLYKKMVSLALVTAFVGSFVYLPPSQAHADVLLGLPAPGTMVSLSPGYATALIKGLTLRKDNPFLFDFVVDTGDSGLSAEA